VAWPPKGIRLAAPAVRRRIATTATTATTTTITTGTSKGGGLHFSPLLTFCSHRRQPETISQPTKEQQLKPTAI